MRKSLAVSPTGSKGYRTEHQVATQQRRSATAGHVKKTTRLRSNTPRPRLDYNFLWLLRSTGSPGPCALTWQHHPQTNTRRPCGVPPVHPISVTSPWPAPTSRTTKRFAHRAVKSLAPQPGRKNRARYRPAVGGGHQPDPLRYRRLKACSLLPNQQRRLWPGPLSIVFGDSVSARWSDRGRSPRHDLSTLPRGPSVPCLT